MAANEPKVTKLKPGEGAGDFRPKDRSGEGRKGRKPRGTPGGQRRTQNPCILEDGTVDPHCKKVYQRSVAGRQNLGDFLREKEAQGMTEKDIFMSAVNALMTRRVGYVGAYLDSKNPGRTYKQNEAMAIADAAMSKAKIGDNPGARLTGESGGGRQRGKKPEPGKAGASIRQQRKQPGGRGGGMGMPETWSKPGSSVDEGIERVRKDVEAGKDVKAAPWDKTDERGLPARPEQRQAKAQIARKDPLKALLDKARAGEEITSEDLDKVRYRKRDKAAPIPGTDAGDKAAAAAARTVEERKKAQEELQAKAKAGMKSKKKEKEGVREEDIEGETPFEKEDLEPSIDRLTIGDKFRELFRDNIKAGLPTDPDSLIEETIDILNDEYGTNLSAEEAGRIISNRFGRAGIDGRRIKFRDYPVPKEPQTPQPGEEQPQPEQKQIERETPESEPQPLSENQLKGKVASEIDTNQLTPDDSMLLLDYKSAMRRLRSGQNMTLGQSDGYEWGVSRGLPATPEDEDKLSASTEEKTPETETLPVQEAKEAIKEISANTSSPEEFKREVMRQLPLYLGRENTAAKLKGRANLEASRVAQQEKELGKPPAAPARRGKAPIQPSLLTASGKARKFPVPEPPAAEPEQEAPRRPVTSKGGFRAPAQARRAQGGGGFTPSPKVVQDVKAAATQAKSLEDFKSYLYNKQPSLFGKRGFDTPESQNIPSTPSEPAPETQPTVPEAAGAGKPGQQSLFRKGTMTPRTGRGFGGK